MGGRARHHVALDGRQIVQHYGGICMALGQGPRRDVSGRPDESLELNRFARSHCADDAAQKGNPRAKRVIGALLARTFRNRARRDAARITCRLRLDRYMTRRRKNAEPLAVR